MIILPLKLADGLYTGDIKGWKNVYQDNISRVLLTERLSKKQFLAPDYNFELYIKEDLAKPVKLN